MGINVIIWNENVHDQKKQEVKDIYPTGIHGCIADFLNTYDDINASTATLQQAEHGLASERLATCDVLLWWGHAAHSEVQDEIVERVKNSVLQGMGLIVLHSGHFSKIFKALMGTSCALQWREAQEKEILCCTNPGHPIARGVDRNIVLEAEEMYGEPFGVPEADETVYLGWFAGGNVFRSGLVYHRGAGKVFYFQPGHESNPIYHNKQIQRIIANAVYDLASRGTRWHDVDAAPNTAPIIPIDGYTHRTEAGLR